MKLIGLINGWAAAPECWRHFLVPPVRIQREAALILDETGDLVAQEAPAVYSVQVLGLVLFLEVWRGLRA